MAEEIETSFPPLDESDVVQVKDFYEGKNVFITGSTGFMGKILIEKLLWDCEDIGNLYLLVRPKKGESVQRRVDDMLKLPIFDRIKYRNGKILSKLIPIAGDVTEQNLGISCEDRQLLVDNVSVFFHAAASVRFDDPIKDAVISNVRGTRDVVNLAKDMKNLKAMVHVSTIYCNAAGRTEIKEKVYEAGSIDWKTMIKVVESQDETILNMITKKIVDLHPNTYTFTKQMAERIVYEARHEIPVMIFRPSIVTNCIKSPFPGWLENMNGPLGLSAGYMTGVVHTVFMGEDVVTDYIPCDYVIDALIVSAWYRGLLKSSECVTIHSAAGDTQNVTTKRMLDICENSTENAIPFERMLWYPFMYVTTNPWLYIIQVYLFHLLPALVLDAFSRLKGDNFSLIRLYRKIFIGNGMLAYFMINDWKIHTQNSYTLKSFMHLKDKDIFNFDMATFNLTTAIRIGTLGLKNITLREDISDEALLKAKKKKERMFILHNLVKGSFIVFFLWFSIKKVLPYLLKRFFDLNIH